MPEIGEDDPKVNPFIKDDGLPDFSTISADKCIRRIGSQSKNLEDEIQKAEIYLKENVETITLNDFFKNVLHPIEKADHELVSTWGLAHTLFRANNVMFPPKSFISMHQRARTANLAKYSNKSIYDAIKTMLIKYESKLTSEQKRLFDMYVLDGRLAGLELTKDYDKEELEFRNSKLSQETITFESKIHVAIEHFSHTITDYPTVQSFPPDLLEAIAVDQKNPLNGPWKVTLKSHIFKTFLEYCPNRELRWNLWRANVQKASRQVVTELDNAPHCENIRDHRNRIRELLGYGSHAELKRERILWKSIESPATLLTALREYAKPAQNRELTQLNDFAVQSGFNASQLEEYDIPYWRRKFNISECKYDENLIQEYFPKDKVMDGLFQLTESLFKLKIIERKIDRNARWHEEVKFYDVFNDDGGQTFIGSFYLDLNSSGDQSTYTAPNGYLAPIREHCDRFNSTPLLSLCFNFRAPLYGKPHTLKLNEVQMVFRKFANTLQKLLNQTNYRELSGLINVGYVNDEVCSGVFSNLLYRNDVLKIISEHVITKEPLTDEHIMAIQSQRLTLAGYNLSMELFKSALDLELATTQQFWLECLRKNWAKHFTSELDKRDARLLSMWDIMIGNWSGCYFVKIWSNIMAADICDAFNEAENKQNQQNDNQLNAIGKRFRDTFLVSGSNTDTSELFRNFRGRDPALDAFVNHLKIAKK